MTIVDPIAVLRELLASKQMREEVSRRKQRRKCSILRDRTELKEVAALHRQCKIREKRAWAAAAALLANQKGT